MRILVSWIGDTDLRAMAAEQPPLIQKKISEVVGRKGPLKGEVGPVRTLVEAEAFDGIYLLSNYPKDITKLFLHWLGREVEPRYISLSNPTDYGAIFAAVDQEMRAITKALDGKQYELFILLSPGTPAMAAIWVLLGKTKYRARFYQTYKNQIRITEIPFDVTVDVLPQLLRGEDSIIQSLASHSPQEIQGFEHIVGDSTAIRLAVGRAWKVALYDVPVLLLGESGTGKEAFARAIHKASLRRDEPFVDINCAAIPQQLMESELFGYKRGAFTGANKNYKGAFEQAHCGTLFLDEIGECAPDIQTKLLRVLQPPSDAPSWCTREIRPLGATKTQPVDVRIVAATNRHLLSMVQEGTFREDLLYRLAVTTIKLPPLRERRSDIVAIAIDWLTKINRAFTLQPGLSYRDKCLSETAQAFMRKYTWPGNVRELYNVLLQAAVMSDKDELGADDLRAAIDEMPTGEPSMANPLELPLGDGFNLDKQLDAIHRHYLQRAMHEADGVKAKAARLLGMQNYQTLDAQLKRLGVEWDAG